MVFLTCIYTHTSTLEKPRTKESTQSHTHKQTRAHVDQHLAAHFTCRLLGDEVEEKEKERAIPTILYLTSVPQLQPAAGGDDRLVTFASPHFRSPPAQLPESHHLPFVLLSHRC